MWSAEPIAAESTLLLLHLPCQFNIIGASQNCSTPASFNGSSELHSENRPFKHCIHHFCHGCLFPFIIPPFSLRLPLQSFSSSSSLKSDPFNSRVKDTVFALMEQLTQARKQGAWIAAKSIPESMHCLSMRLMEERIAHSEKYIDDGNPTPSEFEDPKLYHYAIFSDNVLAASVVVNSAVQNSKNPSLHVFHVVTDKVNFWAMQVMFKMKDYSGAHIEVKVVEDFKFFNYLSNFNLQRCMQPRNSGTPYICQY
uniref:Glycosyltransferase n=1 Tax=Solanum tuberosum TaxID=4113 RepID=M1CPE0_SOLTU